MSGSPRRPHERPLLCCGRGAGPPNGDDGRDLAPRSAMTAVWVGGCLVACSVGPPRLPRRPRGAPHDSVVA